MLFESTQQEVVLRMISTLRDDAQYWRDRATEARDHAEQMTDAVSKNTMLSIAQSYEFLAWRAHGERGDSEKSR